MSSFPSFLRKIRLQKNGPLYLVNENFFLDTETFLDSSNDSTEQVPTPTSLPQTTITETSNTASTNFTFRKPPAATENINPSVNPQVPLITFATVQESPLSPSSHFVAHSPSEVQFAPLSCSYLTKTLKQAVN